MSADPEVTRPEQPREIGPRSTWFPAPDYGMPDATPEELAMEPEGVKALRMLRVLRAYADQREHPFAAVKLDGHELAVLRLAPFDALVDSLLWLHDWQRRASQLMQAMHADLEHELTEAGHIDELRRLVAEEFGDDGGDDD